MWAALGQPYPVTAASAKKADAQQAKKDTKNDKKSAPKKNDKKKK